VYVLLSNLTGYQNATFTAPVLPLANLYVAYAPHSALACLSA
jgi:hypothetical protein